MLQINLTVPYLTDVDYSSCSPDSAAAAAGRTWAEAPGSGPLSMRSYCG